MIESTCECGSPYGELSDVVLVDRFDIFVRYHYAFS